MSLRLLIDEDTEARVLVARLRAAGHDVVTTGDANLRTEADAVVLEYARRENRVLLTHNCGDFEALHEVHVDHPGICAIYEERDRSKNMGDPDIVRALANLEASRLDLAGQFIVLNAWQY